MANINKKGKEFTEKIENELFITIGREDLYLPYWDVGRAETFCSYKKSNKLEIRKTDSDSYEFTFFSNKSYETVAGCFNLQGGLKVTSIFI